MQESSNQPNPIAEEAFKQRYITTTLWKGVTYIALALLGGFISGAFAIGGVLNTDHHALANAIEDIATLQKNTVKADVHEKQEQIILERIAEQKKAFEDLKTNEIKSMSDDIRELLRRTK